jgi:hypothetical protein
MLKLVAHKLSLRLWKVKKTVVLAWVYRLKLKCFGIRCNRQKILSWSSYESYGETQLNTKPAVRLHSFPLRHVQSGVTVLLGREWRQLPFLFHFNYSFEIKKNPMVTVPWVVKPYQKNSYVDVCMIVWWTNTRLFEMIVAVLTTCHTQYSWDRSICIFSFNKTKLQVFVTYLTGALYVHPLWFHNCVRQVVEIPTIFLLKLIVGVSTTC